MSVSSSILAELLPPDSGEWVPVTGGESGASVVYDRVQQRYAKVVASLVPGLAAERDRIVWLNETGIPGPALLDWRESDAGACLVTRAVPGVPANRLDAPACNASGRQSLPRSKPCTLSPPTDVRLTAA